MANIRVTCPACKSELEIDSAHEGQEVECGNCLELFKAARPGSTPAPGSAGGSAPGKIPGAGPRPGGSSGGGRSGSGRKPAPRGRRYEDDDYEHDRRDDYDDEDYSPPPPRRAGGEGDGLATASLILGILALFPGCCCGIVGAPLGLSAVITGVFGLKSQNNKGLAIAGLVLGALALVVTGFAFLFGMGNAMFGPNNRFR